MSASPATATSPRPGTTRERLLEAAIEMFAERGYAATGVDALCRKAGVAKTGLYWEFQNKVGLLNAVIDTVMTEWVEQIQIAARAAGSPRDRLDIALATMRTKILARPELFRVLLVVLAERTQVDDDARAALRRFYKSAHQALVTGIQESVGGILREEELGLACDLILASIEGVFLRAQVYDDTDVEKLFSMLRTSIILLVRELVANQSGMTTLGGRVSEVARPFGEKRD